MCEDSEYDAISVPRLKNKASARFRLAAEPAFVRPRDRDAVHTFSEGARARSRAEQVARSRKLATFLVTRAWRTGASCAAISRSRSSSSRNRCCDGVAHSAVHTDRVRVEESAARAGRRRVCESCCASRTTPASSRRPLLLKSSSRAREREVTALAGLSKESEKARV